MGESVISHFIGQSFVRIEIQLERQVCRLVEITAELCREKTIPVKETFSDIIGAYETRSCIHCVKIKNSKILLGVFINKSLFGRIMQVPQDFWSQVHRSRN